MAIFFNDTFTTVANGPLTSHTSDSGATWLLARGVTVPQVFTAAGGIVASGGPDANLDIARPSIIAPNADVSINSTFHFDTYNFSYVGITARMSANATSGYLAGYNPSLQKWTIARLTNVGDATGFADIAVAATATPYTIGTEPVVVFQVTGTGTSVQLTLTVDGVQLISFADTNALRVVTAGYTGVYFNVGYGAGSGMWISSLSSADVVSTATAITTTGPTSGVSGAASTNFTVAANGVITGTVRVTPNDASGGGTFTPTFVDISSATPSLTFTYTPASAGSKTIGSTNNGSLTNPATITYVASASAATAVTLTGPTSGTTGVASTNFTVGANGPITGTVVVTPNDSANGGTFTPATISLSSATPTGTFTYTPASVGSKTLAVTNNGGLTNPSAITYTSAVVGTVPGAPTIGVATAGTGSASIAFTAGTAGNSATTGYTATATPGGVTFTGVASPITASGLTAGTPYTFTVHATNSTGNSPESAASNSVTPTAVAIVTPQTAKYADLVRDTSTSTSSSTITLAGIAPSGHRTFASSYSLGQKGIPVFYGDVSHGPNWMICTCTLTSANTLTVNSIFSSSAGGITAPTFGAGSKDVFVVVPAAKIFHKDFIDLADYAVDPTFTVDSTAAIQQAILDAYALNITKIRVPCGRYMISGPLVGSGNCQLYIPQTREAAPNKSIYFEGVSPPNFEQQGLRNVPATTNGAIFESTIVGTGTNPAVFGFEQGNSGDAWIWNYTNTGFKNLCVRTFVAPAGGASNSMSALNFQFAAQVAELDMLRIDVSRGLQDMVQPSTGSTGIILPPVDNHLLINIGMVYISGYNTAINAQEHTHIRHFISIGNVNGIVLNGANHGSWIGMMSAEFNKNAIVISGNHDLHIGMYDAEHNGGPNFSFVRDISYISGTRKVSIQHSLVVVAGSGINDAAFTTNATAANYKILVGAGAN